MNRYDEIKSLLSASRKVLKNTLNESEIYKIKSTHGLLTEQEDVEKEYETFDSKEEEGGNEEQTVNKSDKKRAYRISGGIFVIHSKEPKNLQLTTEDKRAFQETMDEFTADVSELVDFDKLNLYDNNVEWSGKINELDVEFFLSIGEKNGIYINGTMTKVDDEYMEFLTNLKQYYDKFKTKWSQVISSRKKTPIE
jgi:hypothetical protein